MSNKTGIKNAMHKPGSVEEAYCIFKNDPLAWTDPALAQERTSFVAVWPGAALPQGSDVREKLEELSRDLYNSEKGRHFALRLDTLIKALPALGVQVADTGNGESGAPARFYDHKQVIEAWVCVRTHNHSIPSEALDDMRDALLTALDVGKAPSRSLVAAIRPFADLAAVFDEGNRSAHGMHSGVAHGWHLKGRDYELTVEQLRNARSAIEDYDARIANGGSPEDPPAPDRDRVTTLLRAAHDLLTIQEKAGICVNLLEEEVFYDGTNCDGRCVINDIRIELELDDPA